MGPLFKYCNIARHTSHFKNAQLYIGSLSAKKSYPCFFFDE